MNNQSNIKMDRYFWKRWRRSISTDALYHAAKCRQVKKIKKLLEKIPPKKRVECVTYIGEYGLNALMWAARHGEVDAIKSLLEPLSLEQKTDYISYTDQCGSTALILAARNGHDEAIKALLDCLNQDQRSNHLMHEDRWRRTAIIYTVKYGYVSSFKLFIEYYSPQQIIDANNKWDNFVNRDPYYGWPPIRFVIDHARKNAEGYFYGMGHEMRRFFDLSVLPKDLSCLILPYLASKEQRSGKALLWGFNQERSRKIEVVSDTISSNIRGRMGGNF